MSRKRNLWRGLTTLTASLLTVSVAAGPVVDSYRTDIDKFLGTKSSAMVTDSTCPHLYCLLPSHKEQCDGNRQYR